MVLLGLVVGLLGLALGSFANVVIARAPQNESVVRPRSACPRCGAAIRSRHNIPIVGWLALRGRCFDCSEPISVRYPVIEGLTGLVFVGLFLWLGVSPELGLALIVAFFTVVLSAIDFDTQRLPDNVVRPFAISVGTYLLAWAATTGSWSNVVGAVIGAAILAAFYFLVWFIYPKGMGFGDVKLAPVLGAVMGWYGWTTLVVGGFAAFVWGAVVGVVVMAVTRRSRMVAIPFGPWMFAGAWTGVIGGSAIAEGYLGLFGL
ncbi:prepilin peptidase [Demequina sp. B12]|uniref:prepilin peptidase n=1 Tax=Demequina sp. B12 TaxID=2992757 RepID=UPI00237C18F3|nr:A24 family peptidase [Demequina sp. B12]MDE0573046.1 prepilin peptidase [Demequina sp. B12]